MKILQVARYGSIRGGLETYIATLCAGLRDAGHEVALAYGMEPDHSRPEVRDGVQIAALVEGIGPRDPLVDAIARYGPDVVHVHVAELAWVAPMARAHAPTLLAAHDHVLDSPVGTRYWAGWSRPCTIRPGVWCLGYNVAAHCGSLRANATLKPYRRWRAANAAARDLQIQVFSEYMRGALALAGLARVRVTHYPAPPPVAPSRLDDQDSRPVVLASGRLNREKGFDRLIDAMEHVRIPSHVVIAGAGHARAALERKVRGMGARHRVTFTGWMDASVLAAWRARAAVVAVPSMWPEPFGIVGLEAMAAGKPVVAFDVGGIGEWLVDGETGRLVPPGDARAMADAISGLLDDEASRERMGANARAHAEASFGLAAHVERVLGLYREVSP
jgi:glycosyltransferase involved in cell wall biosynthesis